MNKNKIGIKIDGSLRSAGITFYTWRGQTITRSAISMQPLRRTRAQFDVRERFLHNRNLWLFLRHAIVSTITYRQFCSLAAKLPPVYLTRYENGCGAVLLLPGIPVSCGTLPDIGYRLGDVDGTPALLTDLVEGCFGGGQRFTLVELRQRSDRPLPGIEAVATDVTAADFVAIAGGLALVGQRFGDPMGGWALVRRQEGRCSTQTVVTHCTYYLAYRTDEALQRAAQTYGGLTLPL